MNNYDDEEDLPEAIRKCLDILDENVEVLTNLERELEDEKEDEFTSKMQLHQLYDMTEDVVESAKLKRAESSLMNRQLKENDFSSL